MKHYFGIAFNIIWIVFYMEFLYPEELGLMILWFFIWLFLLLPWLFISIGGLIDMYDKQIKLVLYDTKMGRYFVFIWGIFLCFWGISIVFITLYDALFLFKAPLIVECIALLASFYISRTGYRIVKKYPNF